MAEPQGKGAAGRERRRERIIAHVEAADYGTKGQTRLSAAEEQRRQRSLEYGVLLTAIGGLAVRFADEGFEFVEDYALRLDHFQATFSPTDSSKEHIRVLFQPIGGAQFSAGNATELLLDLVVSDSSFFWKVSGHPADERLFSSYEVAGDILLKLTDLSEHAVKLISTG